MKLRKLYAIYYLLWGCCLRSCLLKYTLLPGEIHRRKFSLTSWLKSQSHGSTLLLYGHWESCILWALIICSSSLGRREAQSQITISSISVVHTCETFYKTAGWRECSSSTSLDLIKLLSKEAVTKWPRIPISPSPHQHWIWSRCLIFAKIRSLKWLSLYTAFP